LFIPGGYPHAIGEGILMVEIMEPSDLAVRFEFEKAGYTLPESARFMGRGLDFCLDVFDYSQTTLEDIRERYFFPPKLISEYADGAGSRYHLLGSETTPCMQVGKSVINAPAMIKEDQLFIGIVTRGSAVLKTDSDECALGQFDKFLYPAGIGNLRIEPVGEVEILQCFPPKPH
jgi:mannose-6-phosphate isomerase